MKLRLDSVIGLKDIITKTAQLLGLQINSALVEELSEKFLQDNKSAKIILGPDVWLTVSDGFLDKLKVELHAPGLDYFQKSNWQSNLFKQVMDKFQFSTLSLPSGTEVEIDLSSSVGETLQETEASFVESEVLPEPLILKGPDFKCPHCDKGLADDDSLDECPACGGYIWRCPRCKGFIDQDPAELDECPECMLVLCTLECPECGNDIYPDTKKCEQCGYKFKHSKCPDADCGITLAVIDGLERCPVCRIDIELCPRCNGYIPRDFDIDDGCLLCKKQLVTVACPHCEEEDGVFVDSEQCPNCQETLIVSKCPHEECGKPVIWDKDREDCPHCEYSITPIECPECRAQVYIE